jgi:hypothetical protein
MVVCGGGNNQLGGLALQVGGQEGQGLDVCSLTPSVLLSISRCELNCHTYRFNRKVSIKLCMVMIPTFVAGDSLQTEYT